MTSTPLTWLFSELVRVLSGIRGLPELRQLDRIDELKAAGPGGGVLRQTPLLLRRASLFVLVLASTLILTELMILAASLETIYGSAYQTYTCLKEVVRMVSWAPTPSDSDSVGQGWPHELAFLTSSQVMPMLLVWEPYLRTSALTD